MAEKTVDKWTEWMKCEDSQERVIRMFQAAQDQLKLEDMKNCRFIHVRDELVGGVDFETEVRLKLSTEHSPALVFSRQGTNFYVLVYLHQWKN